MGLMAGRIVALATSCLDVSRLGAGRRYRADSCRLELVISPPTAGILALPVKMQPVVRTLTADTLSFVPNARPTGASIGDGDCRTQIR
jgi:hypothetical protein